MDSVTPNLPVPWSPHLPRAEGPSSRLGETESRQRLPAETRSTLDRPAVPETGPPIARSASVQDAKRDQPRVNGRQDGADGPAGAGDGTADGEPAAGPTRTASGAGASTAFLTQLVAGDEAAGQGAGAASFSRATAAYRRVAMGRASEYHLVDLIIE